MAAVVAPRRNPEVKPFMSACLPVTKSKMCALGAPVRKLVYYALAYSERVGLTRITTPKSLDAQDGICVSTYDTFASDVFAGMSLSCAMSVSTISGLS